MDCGCDPIVDINKGADGVGIANITNNATTGQLQITLTDGRVFNYTVQGPAGMNGTNGMDGVSITGVTESMNAQNQPVLVITLSNGTSTTTSSIQGPQGAQGIQGVPGTPGQNGTNGTGSGQYVQLTQLAANLGSDVTANNGSGTNTITHNSSPSGKVFYMYEGRTLWLDLSIAVEELGDTRELNIDLSRDLDEQQILNTLTTVAGNTSVAYGEGSVTIFEDDLPSINVVGESNTMTIFRGTGTVSSGLGTLRIRFRTAVSSVSGNGALIQVRGTFRTT